MRALLLLGLVLSATPAFGLVVNLPPDVGVGVHDVRIEGFRFHPQVLVVGIGSTVTWSNEDEDSHTATDFLTQAWNTDTIPPHEARSVTFGQPGAWAYFCAFHPTMVGVLVVAAEP